MTFPDDDVEYSDEEEDGEEAMDDPQPATTGGGDRATQIRIWVEGTIMRDTLFEKYLCPDLHICTYRG